MRNQLLFRDNYIAIELNPKDNWIYVNWRGYQNYESVLAGCEKIREYMSSTACYRILNDNTQVEGQWSAAAKWVAEVWFPALRQNGLQHFVWVYSSSVLSRLSADKAIKYVDQPDFIHIFDDIEAAQDWLRTN